MSIGKVSEVTEGMGGDFIGLTLEEIKKRIIAGFHEAYGRYINVSGTMTIEIFHAKDGDGVSKVHWIKYEGDEVVEDEVIERLTAIPRLMDALSKGYSREAVALTEEDIEKERTIHNDKRSLLDREGLLGVYRNGSRFVSIRETEEGVYTISRGYEEYMSSCEVNQQDHNVRETVNEILAEGFKKEGTELEEDEPVNALMGFVDDEIKEGGFNPEWFK